MQTNEYGMKGTCNRITKDKARRMKKRITSHYSQDIVYSQPAGWG